MAVASTGFTRYVYSMTKQSSTLRFGIITTSGFTASAYGLISYFFFWGLIILCSFF